MFSFAGAARVLLKALPGARAVRSLFVRDRDGTVAYLDEVQAAVSAAAAADALTVHKAGTETITGAKTFTALLNNDARLYFPQTAANDSLRFRRLENLAGFHNNTSTATGTLVIRLPSAAPNVFFGLRFRLWEYSGRGITTVEACGYIRSTIAFDNTGASSTDVVRVRYVRFARDPAGYWCLLLSNYTPHTSSTWGYPHGQIDSIDLGWAGSNDAAWNDPTQYTVSLITDETGYVVYATTDMQGQVGAATGYNDALNAYMLDGITAAGFAPVAHVGAGAAAHAAATTSVAGFMASADKTKLDALPTTGAAYTLRGNNTAGVAALADLTATQVKALLAYTPADIGAAATGHTHAAATTSVDGFLSAADKTKLDGVAANANNYSLPMAAAGTLGGVKVGSGLSIDAGGVLSASGGVATWYKIGETTPQGTAYTGSTYQSICTASVAIPGDAQYDLHVIRCHISLNFSSIAAGDTVTIALFSNGERVSFEQALTFPVSDSYRFVGEIVSIIRIWGTNPNRATSFDFKTVEASTGVLGGVINSANFTAAGTGADTSQAQTFSVRLKMTGSGTCYIGGGITMEAF